MTSFESFGLPAALIEKLPPIGITEPTEIQAGAIPLILAGQDVILHSQTGTGKTLAYLLPLLTKIDPSGKSLQALIVVPTQELGMQILAELNRLTPGTAIIAQQLIGGANIRHQIDRLKKRPHVVVGTPGRLVELLSEGKLKLHELKTLVLDEIDHLLTKPFMNDLIRILKATPRDRQTLFASATISGEVQEVSQRWMKDPQVIQVAPSLKLPSNLTHAYIVSEARHKADTLRRLLHAYQPKVAIGFVNKPESLTELVQKLTHKGLNVASLSGGSRKQDRAEILRRFRAGEYQLLLASEVAARGLDIREITHVFNLDLPTDADHYLHRAGRTGRCGQAGTVVSVVTPQEKFVIEKFEKALMIPISPIDLSHGQVLAKAAE